MKMLGVNRPTCRGFDCVEFQDANGAACSIQQSSAIGDYDDSLGRPGSSCLWIGVNDANPKILKNDAIRLGISLQPGGVSGWQSHPIPEEVLVTTRMHLNREQVAGLVARLNQWLESGELK